MKSIFLLSFLMFLSTIAFSAEKEDRLKSKINSFLSLVKEGRFDNARSLGSWAFRNSVRDEELTHLQKNFVRSGYTFTFTGIYQHSNGDVSAVGSLKLGQDQVKYLHFVFDGADDELKGIRAE